MWRACGVAVREASGRAQWARWARFDVRCARSAMGCGRRCEGSHRAASDGWMAARRWASRMRKTEVEGGVFHVKHLYADKPHLRIARTHGPSALAGKLRVPSGDPRPELEVSGGGVQTGVQAAEGPYRKASPGGGGWFLASRSRQRVVRSVRRFARDSEPHTARNAASEMARPAQRLRARSVRTTGGGGAALGRSHKGRGWRCVRAFSRCECIWRLEVNGHPALSASPRSLFCC